MKPVPASREPALRDAAAADFEIGGPQASSRGLTGAEKAVVVLAIELRQRRYESTSVSPDPGALPQRRGVVDRKSASSSSIARIVFGTNH